MNDSADYFESLELHPGDPVSTETTGASSGAGSGAEPLPEASEAAQLEIAANLGAILHSDSLDHVVAEVGAACVTRSDVASAVHTAVTDAVQAAVNGVVAVAVAAAVKANSSMNAEEVEKRFRQKYLGLGTPDPAASEAPFLKPPRLQVEEDGSVALSADAGSTVVELADLMPEAELSDTAPVDADSIDDALLEAMLEQHGMADPDEGAEDAAASCTEDSPAELADAVPSSAEEVEAVPAAPVLAEAAPAAPEAVTFGESEPETGQTAAPVEPAAPALPVEKFAAAESAATTPEPVAVTPPVAEPLLAPSVAPEPVAAVEVAPEAVPAPEEVELAPMPDRPAMPQHAQEPESIERTLRDEKSIQFVGFQVGTQMYAVPSILIREVIRRQPISRLPVQSRYAPGVINLRGLVIPLVSLRELLQADMPQEGARNQFCIITGTEGMRIALEVDKIRSMYVIPQADIVWNVGSVLGLDDDTVIGLFELEERLVPILSVERVAAILLEEGIDLEGLSV